SPLERHLIRDGLRLLTLWQVTWFLHWFYFSGGLPQLYGVVTSGIAVPFALGVIGFVLRKRRTGKLPPPRALVAWGSISVWYAVLARDINALFWVQNAHALQYLIFPVRVELNRTTRAPQTGPARLVTHI